MESAIRDGIGGGGWPGAPRDYSAWGIDQEALLRSLIRTIPFTDGHGRALPREELGERVETATIKFFADHVLRGPGSGRAWTRGLAGGGAADCRRASILVRSDEDPDAVLRFEQAVERRAEDRGIRIPPLLLQPDDAGPVIISIPLAQPVTAPAARGVALQLSRGWEGILSASPTIFPEPPPGGPGKGRNPRARRPPRWLKALREGRREADRN